MPTRWASVNATDPAEPAIPPVDRDVIDLDAALGKQLLHVPVGQAEAHVPAHRQHDHMRREPESDGTPNHAEPEDQSAESAA
jgi:hypothetical protein